MAQKDIAEKNLLALNDVFADVYNVLVFQGKQVIKPTDLSQPLLKTQYKADRNMLHETERDVAKYWRSQNINLMLFGLENQTEVDMNMPLRIISYDGSSYRSQLLHTQPENQSNKVSLSVYPVLTFVLYFGKKHWNRNKCLHERLGLQNNTLSKEMQILKEYISDYKINVVEISYLSKEQVEMFQSDFKIVADYFVQSANGRDYIPTKAVIKHVDEVLKLMKILTGDERYETVADTLSQNEKGEGITMCEVLDKVEKRGISFGIELGIELGIQIGIDMQQAIQQGIDSGKAELILTMLRKKISPEYISELTDIPLAEIEQIKMREYILL